MLRIHVSVFGNRSPTIQDCAKSNVAGAGREVGWGGGGGGRGRGGKGGNSVRPVRNPYEETKN